MSRRDGGCPLCGARLKPEQVLDACDEIVDGGNGLLGCRCPYCQGYFEVLPRDGALDIGYLRFGSGYWSPLTGVPVTTDQVAAGDWQQMAVHDLGAMSESDPKGSLVRFWPTSAMQRKLSIEPDASADRLGEHRSFKNPTTTDGP